MSACKSRRMSSLATSVPARRVFFRRGAFPGRLLPGPFADLQSPFVQYVQMKVGADSKPAFIAVACAPGALAIVPFEAVPRL